MQETCQHRILQSMRIHCLKRMRKPIRMQAAAACGPLLLATHALAGRRSSPPSPPQRGTAVLVPQRKGVSHFSNACGARGGWGGSCSQLSI